MSEVLRVSNVKLYYRTTRGIVRAVEEATFTLKERETIALVGESGSGKTSLARAIVRFLPRNVAEFSGSIVIDGAETMGMSNEEFDRKIKWKKVTYVTQAAIASLNPVIKVVDHLVELLEIHKNMSRREAIERAREVVKMVGLPEDFIWRYPFELSGGMRQRVVIALSIITDPKIVILDEPTSALDVMTQANILNMLKLMKKERGLSYIFVTHDIAASSELADKVAVMYAGQIVEIGPAEKMYTDPLHPYSKGLLGSVPRLREEKPVTFMPMPRTQLSLINPPAGCRFADRCPYVMGKCRQQPPPVVKTGSEEYVRCWLYA